MTDVDDSAGDTAGNAARPRKGITIDLAPASPASAGAPEEPAGTPKAASAELPRRGRGPGLFAAALLGGIVAITLGLAYEASGLRPDPALTAATKAAADAAAATAAAKAATDAARAAGEAMSALDARVAALEARPATPGADALAALDGKAADLETALAGLATRLGTLEARPAPSLAATPAAPAAETPASDAAALAGIEARVVRLEAEAPQLAAIATRVGALETTVGALSARVEGLAKEPAVAVEGARTVAIALVRQAADTGRPFNDEIAALAGLGLDEAAVNALRPLAVRGAPPLATLRADFPATADAILAALDVPASDAGFLDRVASFGRGLVSIRPIEAVPGDSPVAVVSRMQMAVDRGDLAAALAERQALPTAGQAASAAWAAGAEARVALDRALAALSAARTE